MDLHGFLVIDKPQGITSHQVVHRLRKFFRIKKIGHTGTLDPLATGVLPVALGEATKVIAYLDEAKKVYEVEATLGRATDTYDAQGEVTEQVPVPPLSRELVEHCLQSFLGKQQQLPPLYSAIKIKGKAAYSYARKGETPLLEPREIIIDSLELLSFAQSVLKLRVDCSRGTYVRSLVHDLGLRLGTRAHVSELRRLQSGVFCLEQALSLEEAEALGDEIQKKILSIEQVLSHLSTYELASEQDLLQVQHGVILNKIHDYFQYINMINKTITLTYEGRVKALMIVGEAGLSYQRVLQDH